MNARAHLPQGVDDGMCLVLPYPVSANRYWRSFVPRGSQRAVTVVSDEAKAYKREVAWLAQAAGLRLIAGPVDMEIDLYPARPQDWAKRARKAPSSWWYEGLRRLDLGNCEKVLSDALQGIAYVDDAQIVRQRKELMEPDEHGARVVVVVRSLAVAEIPQGGLFDGDQG